MIGSERVHVYCLLISQNCYFLVNLVFFKTRHVSTIDRHGLTLAILDAIIDLVFDHPSCPILYKILVSVLKRPFLHKQNSKSCHYLLLVCDSKSENLSGHFFVSS